MKGKTHIQLIGTPSTTFTYVQHIIEQIIDRADLDIPIEQITDISKIIDLKINVIPTLKINDREFRFHTKDNTNDILKQAILHLLKKEEFGNWPVLLLATEKVGDAYHLANDLARKSNAVIEWILKDQDSNTILKEKLVRHNDLDSIIKRNGKGWIEQLFSEPLINYQLTHRAAKSACLPMSKQRNTLAIITDRKGTYNWPLIFNWIDYCKVPLIIANDSGHYQAPKRISVIVDQDRSYNSDLLLQLLNGNKNNISQHLLLPVHSTAVLENDEHASDFVGFENFLEDLSHTSHPDMWAFHFSQKDLLFDFLKDVHIRRWMNKVEQPMVFLPLDS